MTQQEIVETEAADVAEVDQAETAVVDVVETVADVVEPVADVVEETETPVVGEVVASNEVTAGDDAPVERTVSKREEALTNEGEIAADYLEELLDIADLDGDIDTYNEGGRAHVSVITDADVLIGRNGEVLEALQELARLAVMTETGHRSRLMLDIGGHRDRQRASLQDLAADAVSEVKGSGEPVRLAPMNPYQRKVVHDAIAAAGLGSESEGEEPNRRVVVLPKP